MPETVNSPKPAFVVVTLIGFVAGVAAGTGVSVGPGADVGAEVGAVVGADVGAVVGGAGGGTDVGAGGGELAAGKLGGGEEGAGELGGGELGGADGAADEEGDGDRAGADDEGTLSTTVSPCRLTTLNGPPPGGTGGRPGEGVGDAEGLGSKKSLLRSDGRKAVILLAP